MKTFLGFLLGVCFMGFVLCASENDSNTVSKVYADEYNFNYHNGKIVKSIQFLEYPKTIGGYHDVVIKFTDGTELRMLIYKYKPYVKL